MGIQVKMVCTRCVRNQAFSLNYLSNKNLQGLLTVVIRGVYCKRLRGWILFRRGSKSVKGVPRGSTGLQPRFLLGVLWNLNCQRGPTGTMDKEHALHLVLHVIKFSLFLRNSELKPHKRLIFVHRFSYNFHLRCLFYFFYYISKK